MRGNRALRAWKEDGMGRKLLTVARTVELYEGSAMNHLVGLPASDRSV